MLNRHRQVSREELVDALWSGDRPPNAEACLSSVLSRLRRMLGPGVLEGRRALSVALPEDAWVDVEAAADALDRATTAAAAEQWTATAVETSAAIEILERGFLPGYTGLWIDDQAARIDELLLHARQYAALARLARGELVSAERASRALIAAAPFREEGYRLLMEVHAAAGNVAEALLVYELIRCLLREELGTTPAPGLTELHRRLLTQLRRPADIGASAPRFDRESGARRRASESRH